MNSKNSTFASSVLGKKMFSKESTQKPLQQNMTTKTYVKQFEIDNEF